MTSLRHSHEPTRGSAPTGGSGPTGGSDGELLDAARDGILAVGWRRTTLTDVARRAGVSRMTIYRRWPDMATLLADLLTREWGGLAALSTLAAPGQGDPRPALARLVAGVTGTVAALRDDELFAKIVAVDPELLLPYLLRRRGRTQDAVLRVLEATLTEGQRDGSVRDTDPVLLARSVLLAVHGFVLSSATMTDDGPTAAQLDAELGRMIERYLAA